MTTHTADVIIWGGTAAAMLAAKAVSAAGRTCWLLNPGSHWGGMTTGGLSNMDFGPSGSKGSIIGGFTRGLLANLDTLYSKSAGTLTTNPEPHAVGGQLNNILALPGISYLTSTGPIVALTKSGGVITDLNIGGDYVGSTYIDASYEGDLLALSGATYSYGMDASANFRENTSAGPGQIAGFQQPSGAYTFSGLDANGQRLNGIGPIPKPSIANGDAYSGVQPFNFRLCLSNSAPKKTAFTAPSGYSAANYKLLSNYLAANPGVIKLVGTPGDAVSILGGVQLATNSGYNIFDCNTNGTISSDFHAAGFGRASMSDAYINGSVATRSAIATACYQWLAGLLYFVANDASLASTAVQTDAQTYGYDISEFASDYFGQQYFPPQLYIREGRRLQGQYIMTLADVASGATQPDSVCQFNYAVDVHPGLCCPYPLDLSKISFTNGYNSLSSPASPYRIPWRAMIPQLGQCDNLIVPQCLSSTHLAWGALRLELLTMMTGEAAGAAAALCAINGVTPQKLPYSTLAAALIANGALL